MKQSKASAPHLMQVVEQYITTILQKIPGIKALNIDKETLPIISLAYSQSSLLKENVYLTTKIEESSSEKLPTVVGVYLLRPTDENVRALARELGDPRFKQYHLVFTNQLHQAKLRELAEADSRQLVRSVQQAYIDYYALGKNIFSLEMPNTSSLYLPKSEWSQSDQGSLKRIVEGLFSFLLSLRVIPQIKSLRHSDACRTVATSLTKLLEKERTESLSNYNQSETAILLVTSRGQDCATPLVSDWTYLPMLHELVGVRLNRVNLKLGVGYSLADPDKAQDDLIVSEKDDAFFKQNSFKSFPDLYAEIKRWIDEVGRKQNKAVNIESVADMHDAVQAIPQLKALSGTLSKHITLSSELTKIVNQRKLMEPSRVEQEIVCGPSRSDNLASIKKLLLNPEVKEFQKLKAFLLFKMRYRGDKELPELLAVLMAQATSERMQSLVGSTKLLQNLEEIDRGRKSDLFFNKDTQTKAIKYVKSLIKDVPNVYCQHRPFLFQQTLPDLLERRKDELFEERYKGLAGTNQQRPLVIVFQIGGTTFTEAKEALLYDGARVLVGGTFVHNSRSFLSEVSSLRK